MTNDNNMHYRQPGQTTQPTMRTVQPNPAASRGAKAQSGAGQAPSAVAGAKPSAGVRKSVDPNRGGHSGNRTILLVLGIVVAAIAIWVVVWLFACNGSSLFDPDAKTGQAPYKTAEEMQAELDRVVEEGMFNISIASVIQFENGTAPGTAYIENVPGNHYNMQVVITDDDSGDVLYESGILKPNQFIENIILTKDLEPGTYDATATFTALDESTYEEVGKAAAKVTLNVAG